MAAPTSPLAPSHKSMKLFLFALPIQARQQSRHEDFSLGLQHSIPAIRKQFQVLFFALINSAPLRFDFFWGDRFLAHNEETLTPFMFAQKIKKAAAGALEGPCQNTHRPEESPSARGACDR